MEPERQIPKRQQWFAALVLTVSSVFCLEVFLMLYGTFSDKLTTDFPWTFHWMWEIFVLIGFSFIIKRFQISIGKFAGITFFGLIVISVVWLFIPESIKVIKVNYYGVESRLTNETHEEGRYDEQVVNDFPLRLGFLYKADDPELLQEFVEKSNYNEYVATKGFLFWQTGLAYGFVPYRINEFNGGHTFLDHIELFFTVGPMVLVECLINSLYQYFFILLLIQVVWLLIKKEHIWWSE